MTDPRPDNNAQLGQPRTCTTCGHTAVPRPWAPGWTPNPPDGWTCPNCTRNNTPNATP